LTFGENDFAKPETIRTRILSGTHILHNSHFRLSKNTVSNETHGRKSREF